MQYLITTEKDESNLISEKCFDDPRGGCRYAVLQLRWCKMVLKYLSTVVDNVRAKFVLLLYLQLNR